MPSNGKVNALHSVPRTETAADEWDAVVRGSSDGWVFGLYGWQELILAVERWGLQEHSFALRENGRLVAVVPLQLSPNSGVMASSGWGGAGPILDGSLSAKARRRVMGEAISRCIEAAQQCGARSLEIPLSPVTKTSTTAPWSVNPLVLFGLEDSSGLSRVIDLSSSEEELWADLTPDARRQIRLAREAGYVVGRADWTACLDHYYELHSETCRRTGVTPHPRGYFAGIARYTAPGGHSVLWRVRDASGSVVGYHNDACFGNGAYYHTGCSAGEMAVAGAGYLLFWEAMVGARAAGARWYDCGAIFPGSEDPKQRGLTTFKTKFGGETHRLFRGRIEFAFSTKVSATEQTPTRRRAVRSWLSANRQFLATFAGETAAARAAGLVWRGVNAVIEARSQTRRGFLRLRRGALTPVSFMRPYWDNEELRIGGSPEGVGGGERRRLAQRLRTKVAVSEDDEIILTGSGRSALELGLRVLREQHPNRDKVLIPSFGCRGIYDPVVNSGLTPVFVEVDDDLLPDADDMIAQMDETILACVLVHTCGKQMSAERVAATAGRLGIFVVEDECHALGKPPSPYSSDLRILSFGVGKSAMASAGGALIASVLQDQVRQAASTLREEPSASPAGRHSYFLQRYFSRRRTARMAPIGTDFLTQYKQVRLSPLDATLMTSQIAKLDQIVSRRQRNSGMLRPIFESRPDLFHLQSCGSHTYTKFSVTFRDQELAQDFRSHMTQWGIELEEMYFPLHERPFSERQRFRALPRTESLKNRVLNVPVRPNLSARQLHRVAQAVAEFAETQK